MPTAILVLTTLSQEADVERIAKHLLEERLAACVQVQPIRSWYRWKGAVANDAEFLLLIKTRAERFPALEERLRQMHPYELPEIVRVPIEGGLAPYLEWIEAETQE